MSFDTIEKDLQQFIESQAEYVQTLGEAYARLWPVVQQQINESSDVEFSPFELANSTGETVPDTLAFLNYLAGQRANLLYAVFSFTDTQGKEYNVKAAQVADVLDGKEFHHPETKEIVTEPDTKIRMFYRLQKTQG